MQYQYDSVNNHSTYVEAVDHRDEYVNHHRSSCRIPCALLVPIVLFAAFVGHISTIAYIGTLKQGQGQAVVKSIKDDPAKAQKYAQEQFDENLLQPCQEAEDFYDNSSGNSNGERTVLAASRDNSNQTQSPPPPPPPKGCLATLLVFRHCEAGVAREHCGYMGELRSEYLATLFGPDARWPEPSYIYAMKAAERHNEYVENWREIETVEPLSKKFNITIDRSFGYPEKKKLVKHLYHKLRRGDFCGKTIVISWKHHDMPHFAHEMGCGPTDGCPMTYGEEDYEAVFQLTYSYHKERFAPFAVEDTTPHGMSKRHPWGKHPQWFVYGTVQQENFDPLVFTTENVQFMEQFDQNY